ncbi:MAG: 1-acyl-sn-glycerol-3-phosphate acyltransferase [Bacteroidales bacterium]
MSTNSLEHKLVLDLDSWIKGSTSIFFRALPPFLIQYLKRVVRQDEINILHNRHHDKMGMEYVNALLIDFKINIRIHNEHLLEKADRCIFVANHPLGGADSLSLLHCIHKLKGKVVSPSNQFFNYCPNLRPLIVGVNVFGKSSSEQIRAINEVFRSDSQIMIFPAGLVSRHIKGKIQDPEWHKSFISKAIQTERFVVPAFISGKNSKKFYRLSRWRKFFRIKMPVEVLLLPQELLNKRGSDIDVVFGDPIPHTTFDHSKTPHQWAQTVREMVYELGEKNLTTIQNDPITKPNPSLSQKVQFS